MTSWEWIFPKFLRHCRIEFDGWSGTDTGNQNRNLSQSPEIQAFWEDLKSGNFPANSQKSNYVAPLLYSEWGQHTYYNAWCPLIQMAPADMPWLVV
ncbi:MAG: hypothetical protein R2759_06695 [Bacteroidales bacterium]